MSKHLEDLPAVLFIGDVHVGRRPESLASVLEDGKLRTRDLSPAAAWMHAVEHAVETGAVAVVMAGDVIDREEDLLEAYNVVERGARILERAEIPLIAVAGNHDAKLLPRLAKNVDTVQILGEGGTWDSTVLTVGEQTVELIGWSFPRPHYAQRPLQDPSLAPLLNMPRSTDRRILIVHGDLDASTSNYAPIQRNALKNLDIDAAFLGHIHRPDPLTGARPIGYLGSLVGLDAGERGEHGPVEVRLAASGTVVASRIPMAPVRWDAIDVDVHSELPWTAARLKRHLNEQVAAWFDAQEIHPSTQVLALRVRFVGRREIDGWQQAIHAITTEESRAIFVERARCTVFVERYVDETLLRRDLETVAREQTPAGRLARFLQTPIDPQMRQRAASLLAIAWADENLPFPEDFDVEAALRRASQRTLERMLDARAGGGQS